MAGLRQAAPLTIAGALSRAASRLGAVDGARLDAEILLAHVLARPRAFLYTWPERALGEAQLERFFALVARRTHGEPVALLTGTREFWSLELRVAPETLIPRPETEHLVELALERIPPHATWRVVDLGTGCGSIALAIARERPRCHVVATDRCAAALATARANAERLGLGHVEFRAGQWCAPLGHERFDLIASNPPYIPTGDPALRDPALGFEPREALVAGVDGLDAIRCIAGQAPTHLRPGGWLLLEHGHDQGESAPALLRASGFAAVADFTDTAGRPRVCVGRAAEDSPEKTLRNT